jgi:hypothetical protein
VTQEALKTTVSPRIRNDIESNLPARRPQ